MVKLFLVALLVLVTAGCVAERPQAALEALANGTQAAEDRADAAKAADAKLATVRPLLPWTDWREHALDQTCTAMSAGLFTQVYWVTCSTNLTTYAGFTGDLPAEILRTDGIVPTAGWYEHGPSSAASAVYDLQHNGPVPKVEYTDEEPTTCEPSNWTLTQRWLGAGDRLLPGDGKPTPSARDQALYWDVATLDHDAVQADILTRYQYVVIVSLTLTCEYGVDD